jgi:hypothetical protein
LVRCHARISILRKAGRGGRGGRDDQVSVVIAFIHNGAKGKPATATGHVGDLNRRVYSADIIHDFANGPAGEIPTATGVGRGNTFGGHR